MVTPSSKSFDDFEDLIDYAIRGSQPARRNDEGTDDELDDVENLIEKSVRGSQASKTSKNNRRDGRDPLEKSQENGGANKTPTSSGRKRLQATAQQAGNYIDDSDLPRADSDGLEGIVDNRSSPGNLSEESKDTSNNVSAKERQGTQQDGDGTAVQPHIVI